MSCKFALFKSLKFFTTKIVILHNGEIIKEIKNPKFTPNTLKYFELKSVIYKLINGEIENIEYMI
ncbi:hypothetical protein [Campylobacter lanienae]|uniref:hypothetical protein n=1 Tax=Campylobacter lanienae TaxID=75658 RepID=UPI000BB43B62|nr:hypothetical protein [Campylobacter lanienae]